MVISVDQVRDLAHELYGELTLTLTFPNGIVPIHPRFHHIFYVDVPHNKIDVYNHDNDSDVKRFVQATEEKGIQFHVTGHYK